MEEGVFVTGELAVITMIKEGLHVFIGTMSCVCQGDMANHGIVWIIRKTEAAQIEFNTGN